MREVFSWRCIPRFVTLFFGNSVLEASTVCCENVIVVSVSFIRIRNLVVNSYAYPERYTERYTLGSPVEMRLGEAKKFISQRDIPGCLITDYPQEMVLFVCGVSITP